MDTPAPPAQQVYDIVLDGREVLQDAFAFYYQALASGSKLEACDTKASKVVQRYFSGSPSRFQNVVLGIPPAGNASKCIKEQVDFFKKEGASFVWLLEEGRGEQFIESLRKNRFENIGTYQGVLGPIDGIILEIKFSSDYEFEQVLDPKAMDEFYELLVDSSVNEENPIIAYKQALWAASNGSTPQLFHWVARYNGKVVSIVTTAINDEVVSFWNSKTDPAYRKKGISTALRHRALSHAKALGCKYGASFHLTEGPAQRICYNLGYQPKWRFDVFVPPQDELKTSVQM